ncbi:hypothetical protein O4H26_11280 [Aequorivita viscosa]|nr:hypothetical protein [Aequorivita viscosa]
MNNEKYKLLRKGIVFDLIGMATMVIPVIGPFLDLIWAPIAAKKMTEMYKGIEGKVASVIVFLEEILPITDIIPTFTLMWLYTFVWKKQPTQRAIKIRVNE